MQCVQVQCRCAPALPRFCVGNRGLRALNAATEAGFWLPAVHQASTDLNKPRRPHLGRRGGCGPLLLLTRGSAVSAAGGLFPQPGAFSAAEPPFSPPSGRACGSAGASPGGLGIWKKLASQMAVQFLPSPAVVCLLLSALQECCRRRRWLGRAPGPFSAAPLHRFRPLGLPEPSSEREVKSRLAGLVRSCFFAVSAFSSPCAHLNFRTSLPQHRFCICTGIHQRMRRLLACKSALLSLVCPCSASLQPHQGAAWRMSSPQTLRPQPLSSAW